MGSIEVTITEGANETHTFRKREIEIEKKISKISLCANFERHWFHFSL